MKARKRCFEDRVNLVFFSTYDWQTRTKKVVTCKKRILRNISMYTYAGLESFTTENSDLERKRDSGRQNLSRNARYFWFHDFFSLYSSRCLDHANQSNGHKKININSIIILKKILKFKNEIIFRFYIVIANKNQN
jgi:hypothetical protein